MSNAFIEGLVATAAPVPRRRVWRDVGIIAILGAVQFIGLRYLLPMDTFEAAMGANPIRMSIKVSVFALATVIFSGMAVLSFYPSANRHNRVLLATIAAFVVAILLGFEWRMPSGLPLGYGFNCMFAILAMSLPVMLGLGLLMTAGASTRPRRSALLIGLAGGAFGAFIFAFQCPIVSVAYMVTWYGGGIASAAGIALMLLPRIIRW